MHFCQKVFCVMLQLLSLSSSLVTFMTMSDIYENFCSILCNTQIIFILRLFSHILMITIVKYLLQNFNLKLIFWLIWQTNLNNSNASDYYNNFNDNDCIDSNNTNIDDINYCDTTHEFGSISDYLLFNRFEFDDILFILKIIFSLSM